MQQAAHPPLKDRLADRMVVMRREVTARCASGELGFWHCLLMMQTLKLFETLVSGLILLLELQAQGKLPPIEMAHDDDAVAPELAVRGKAAQCARRGVAARGRKGVVGAGQPAVVEPGAVVGIAAAWADAREDRAVFIMPERVMQPRWADGAVDYGGFLGAWFFESLQGLSHTCV